MSRLVIIGYGNTLRGDDAVGFLAAERLRRVITGPDIEILAVQQLTPELADPISHAGRVIFIDAAVTGEPGVIEQRQVRPVDDSGEGFTHHSTPEGLLAAAAAFFGRAPEAVHYSIPGVSFELGEELSAPVAKALEALVPDLADVAAEKSLDAFRTSNNALNM